MIVSDEVMMPRRATKGSAGYDFYAPEDVTLEPGTWTKIDTGVRFSDDNFPILLDGWVSDVLESEYHYNETYIRATLKNWFMMLVPRSGLGTKYGVRFRNTIGIIDSDYRDTIKMVLTADEPVTIHKGERIAQGIIVPYGVFLYEIKPTEERHGGHGSTGA